MGRSIFTNKGERRNLQPDYATVPTWWFGVTGLAALALGMFSCEYYSVQLRWFGFIFAFAVSLIFFVPVGTSLYFGTARSLPCRRNCAADSRLPVARLGVCDDQRQVAD